MKLILMNYNQHQTHGPLRAQKADYGKGKSKILQIRYSNIIK